MDTNLRGNVDENEIETEIISDFLNAIASKKTLKKIILYRV